MKLHEKTKIRYRAEWVISHGDQPADSFEYDLVEYGNRLFADRQKAQEYAHEHDLYNEGRVFVEELRTQHDPIFEHGKFQEWVDIEIDHILESGEIETEKL